jgi:ankyrin repeat protein
LSYFSADSNTKKSEEPDYNKQDNRKRTILHRAAAAGHIGVVKGLLSIESVNPNQLEKDQCTPLGLALRDDHEKIAHILIEKEKIDVNLGGGSFGAPIHIAVSKNKEETIRKLVKRNVDVNKVDFKLQTPLHIIMDVFSRDALIAESITRLLVFNGASPNLQDSDKLTPLHRAVIKKHNRGIDLILQLNKELNARHKEMFDINFVGGVGDKRFSALYFALEKKAPEIAEKLFQNGARVCVRINNEYLPREWKKRETNIRRHILWKMEKFESDKRNNYHRYSNTDFNSPKTVKLVEGFNN